MRRMRIFGRIEKAVLALLAGFVFMGFATVVAPGLQTLVAPAACPAGSVDALVVRYPRVVEPVEMVRNTPLVCVGPDGAALASHARVLPALIAVGFVSAGTVIVLLSVVAAGVVRRNSTSAGTAPTPTPPRSILETVRWVTLVIAAPFVFMVAYGSYWWLAVDTPYRVTSCESSDGGASTCYDGESVYRFLTLLFGALALAVLVAEGGTVDAIYDRGDTSVAFTIPPELAAQPPRPESDPSPLISS